MTDRGTTRTAPKAPRWPARVQLQDGSEIDIRPIRKTDKRRLVAGFEQLSPESRASRFLTPMEDLSPPLLRYLTEVDHHDHEALVALDRVKRELIGVARYVRSADDPDSAEVAVTVVDHWHRHGVATELLERLAARASEEGIARFTATCLVDNREALELFDELRMTPSPPSASGLVEAHIDLPDEEGSGRLSAVLRAAARHGLQFRPQWARSGSET